MCLGELRGTVCVPGLGWKMCSETEPKLCLTAVLPKSTPVVQDDPQADQLLGSLDRVGKDLVQVEKEVLNRVRSPVSYTDPTDDLARRIKQQQVGASVGRGGKHCGVGPKQS